MLWTKDWYGWNGRATSLLEHPDAEFLYGDLLAVDEEATGDAYIVLNQTIKPSVDIHTSLMSADEFEQQARPMLINGWWRAIQIEEGWRVFGDCENDLITAKLALSS